MTKDESLATFDLWKDSKPAPQKEPKQKVKINDKEYYYIVYGFINAETGLTTYIGSDSNGDKEQRHREHYQPSQYKDQLINRELQDNPGKYEYIVLADNIASKELMLLIETEAINLYKPKFNVKMRSQGKGV